MKEILDITMLIKRDFPTLYATLDETPVQQFRLKVTPCVNDLEDYLNTLKLQLKNLDMKKKMDDLKFDSKSSWESFKNTFIGEMDELVRDIKEFSLTDKDNDKKK